MAEKTDENPTNDHEAEVCKFLLDLQYNDVYATFFNSIAPSVLSMTADQQRNFLIALSTLQEKIGVVKHVISANIIRESGDSDKAAFELDKLSRRPNIPHYTERKSKFQSLYDSLIKMGLNDAQSFASLKQTAGSDRDADVELRLINRQRSIADSKPVYYCNRCGKIETACKCDSSSSVSQGVLVVQPKE